MLQVADAVAGRTGLFVHAQIGLITLSGVSASGKNWTASTLQSMWSEIRMVRSVTTRPLRPGQDDEYDHVSLEEFERLRPELVWSTQPHGEHWYGTRRQSIHDAMFGDVPSVMHIIHNRIDLLREYVRSLHCGKEVLSILVVCRSEDILRRRLRHRDSGISDQDVERRLQGFKDKQQHALSSGIYHYVIESSDTKNTAELQQELREYVSNPIPDPRVFA